MVACEGVAGAAGLDKPHDCREYVKRESRD
jgi:hypothetical protein